MPFLVHSSPSAASPVRSKTHAPDPAPVGPSNLRLSLFAAVILSAAACTAGDPAQPGSAVSSQVPALPPDTHGMIDGEYVNWGERPEFTDHPTIAMWVFDEQQGLYPSKVLHDVGPNEYILSLGRAGYIVPGRFGNALEIAAPREQRIPSEPVGEKYGVEEYPIPEGRTVEPMTWQNATFAALMTSAEKHIRTQVRFSAATSTGLNLGAEDWTVEFWYQPSQPLDAEGVVFEIGSGPRGENEQVTRLTVDPAGNRFRLVNQPGGVDLTIPTDQAALDPSRGAWAHIAFVHEAATGRIRHYVDGRPQPSPAEAVALRKLPVGPEDYFTLGTDAHWRRPLNGRLDEVRFSRGRLYDAPFDPPQDLASTYLPEIETTGKAVGPPLLFTPERLREPVVELGTRKHLFIDDALIERQQNVTFQMNPPRVAERIMRFGPERDGFRKHLDTIEDEDGRIRIYNALYQDHLGVWISDDGIDFRPAETPYEINGVTNMVIPGVDGDGTMFLDPNAPPHQRWKYVTGVSRRGTYLYTSPDGYTFTKHKLALLPFRAASQNDVYWDDQRREYIGYWRSGFPRTPAGETQREFVMSTSPTLQPPMPFTPVTTEQTLALARTKRLSPVIPWYMDNGPLTPGKFGIEFPTVFAPDDEFDSASAGIYNPKGMKYPWAPDTYLAFPVFYFEYYEEPEGRQYHVALRGGGPTESQFAASRDGETWTRYPRPAYFGVGRYDDLYVVQNYISKGMVRRGDEIWQYVFVDSDYHSSSQPRTFERGVYRLVQRLDGFVSIDSPYGEAGTVVTRPILLEGDRLTLNLDTDAQGYAIVSLLDENDRPIPGYGPDEAVYINGDHVEIDARWIGKETDLSELRGRTVKVRFDMRGTKLYAMQFRDGAGSESSE